MSHSRFAPHERVRLKLPLHPITAKCCALMDWDPNLNCVVAKVDPETNRITVIAEDDAPMLAFKTLEELAMEEDHQEIELPEECFEHLPVTGRALN